MKGRKGQIRYDRMGKNPKYFINEQEVTKKEWDEAFPDKPLEEPLPAHTPSCWPMVSEALAVHPDQVAEANERAKKAGIDATYEKGTGMCQLGSRGARAKLIKLEGMHDKSGGYGDG